MTLLPGQRFTISPSISPRFKGLIHFIDTQLVANRALQTSCLPAAVKSTWMPAQRVAVWLEATRANRFRASMVAFCGFEKSKGRVLYGYRYMGSKKHTFSKINNIAVVINYRNLKLLCKHLRLLTTRTKRNIFMTTGINKTFSIIFSPPRLQDTKFTYNKHLLFVSWCLCGCSFRFIRLRNNPIPRFHEFDPYNPSHRAVGSTSRKPGWSQSLTIWAIIL